MCILISQNNFSLFCCQKLMGINTCYSPSSSVAVQKSKTKQTFDSLAAEPKISFLNFMTISKFYPQKNSSMTRKLAIKKEYQKHLHTLYTSSSCRADCIDFPDSLSLYLSIYLSVPVIHCFWQIFQTISCVRAEQQKFILTKNIYFAN